MPISAVSGIENLDWLNNVFSPADLKNKRSGFLDLFFGEAQLLLIDFAELSSEILHRGVTRNHHVI
jgi:hypothetical protein